MSAFFSKLFTLFPSKIAKTAVLALCCKVLTEEGRLGINLVRKCSSVTAELLCASTESKRPLRKLYRTFEIKKNKLRILRCAFTG